MSLNFFDVLNTQLDALLPPQPEAGHNKSSFDSPAIPHEVSQLAFEQTKTILKQSGRYGDWLVEDIRDAKKIMSSTGPPAHYVEDKSKMVYAIVPKKFLKPAENRKFRLNGRKWVKTSILDCKHHFTQDNRTNRKKIKFSNFDYFRKTGTALGTAFAIGPHHLLTCGHNVEGFYFNCKGESQEMNPKDYFLLREYRNDREFEPEDIMDFTKVKSVTKISRDWALIKVDKEIPYYQDVVWEWEQYKTEVIDANPKHSLYALGHPLGLPQKVHYGAEILWDRDYYSFVSNVDAFSGNSGSPVFCGTTHKLLGLVFRGQPDFEYKVPSRTKDGADSGSEDGEQQVVNDDEPIWQLRKYSPLIGPGARGESILKLSSIYSEIKDDLKH